MALAALFVSAGQAQGASESPPQEEAASAPAPQTRQAEREERVAARKAEREAARAARKAEREAEKRAAREREETKRAAARQRTGSRGVQNNSRPRSRGDVEFSCTGVTWKFTNFPAGSNTVAQVVRLYVNESAGSPDETITIPGSFTFTGPSGETTTPFQAPAGVYKVDAWAKWTEPKGSFDILGKLACSPEPAMAVEKLQKIAVSTEPYTSAPVTGLIGETVDYEIVVKNTGNVPLTITSADVVDPQCGAISGGPSPQPLDMGKSTTFTCTHVLTESGSYTNTAEVSGVPPAGPPIGVTVQHGRGGSAAAAGPSAAGAVGRKAPGDRGRHGSYTTSPVTGQVGQIVQYEIVVHNTGNVSLELSSFSDPQCDPGTVSGGPGGAALPVGASTTYTCTHVLDARRPVRRLLLEHRHGHRRPSGRRGRAGHAGLEHGGGGSARLLDPGHHHPGRHHPGDQHYRRRLLGRAVLDLQRTVEIGRAGVLLERPEAEGPAGLRAPRLPRQHQVEGRGEA